MYRDAENWFELLGNELVTVRAQCLIVELDEDSVVRG